MSTVYRLKLAEVPFELVCVSDEHNDAYDKYLTDDEPLFSLTTDRETLERWHAGHISSCIKMGIEPDPQYFMHAEAAIFFAELCGRLTEYGVFTVHGSSLSLDGNGYLFTAHRDTGKSTHASLWREVFGDRCVMINDDKPFIRKVGGEFRVYGSPFSGKHKLDNNVSAPLKAIAQIVRSETNRTERISCEEAFPLLMTQFFGRFSGDALVKTSEFAKELLESVPFFKLYCNMEPDAAKAAYEGLI